MWLFSVVFLYRDFQAFITIIIIIIIIIIIEFLSFSWEIFNLSWYLVINRIRLGGLSYNLESFLQLNMCEDLQIFAFAYIYFKAI
jgi:hypothetical protein